MSKITNLTASPLALPSGAVIPAQSVGEAGPEDLKHEVVKAMMKSGTLAKGDKSKANATESASSGSSSEAADLEKKIAAAKAEAIKGFAPLVSVAGNVVKIFAADEVDGPKAEKALKALDSALKKLSD